MDKKITKNEDEWKKELTEEQYRIMREKQTEAPFTGKLIHSKDKGVYCCAACGNQLFSSDAKYDSKTGWPSFDKALPGRVEFRDDNDLGVHRVEVVCARCNSHLGHLFDDGPKETTGQRYCINSVCLRIKKDK